MSTRWVFHGVDMSAKVVLVTGANAGIGFATTLELVQYGVRVIMACRSLERGQQALAEIRHEYPDADVKLMILDISSMKSVKKFADEFLSCEDRLDVLINNAAVTASATRRETPEGIEHCFATNYLGAFYLTSLLTDLLIKSAPSRVVNVSSSLYYLGDLDMDDLDYKTHPYPAMEYMYGNSKLALNTWTVELSRRLWEHNVTVNCLHPGVVATKMNEKESDWRHYFWNILLQYFGKSPQDGAATTVFLAVSDSVKNETGKYFVDCKEVEMPASVYDEDVGMKLWERSQAMVEKVLNSQQNNDAY